MRCDHQATSACNHIAEVSQQKKLVFPIWNVLRGLSSGKGSKNYAPERSDVNVMDLVSTGEVRESERREY